MPQRLPREPRSVVRAALIFIFKGFSSSSENKLRARDARDAYRRIL
jgi:hypothetical protein